MTALGKILAIFVFLFSLVWCGLVVTGHVTRTNWKAAFEAERKKHQETAAAATDARAELDRQGKAHAAQVAALTNDIKTLKEQNNTLNVANQNQNNANQGLLTVNNKLTKENAIAQANLTQANTQNDLLFERSARVETERNA